MHMPVQKSTIKFILDRLRDYSSDVRQAAYEVIKGRTELKALSVAQRALLIRSGLKDR